MMKSITRKTPIFWFVLCCLGINVQATSGLLPWVQKPDSLLLPSGTTYRYTMDTPEGEGLVPTLFSVNELLERFAETNGVPCRLVDSRGMQKYGGLPQDGDRMELHSPEGKSIRRWAKGVKRAALPARLHLDRTRATVNVPGILTLDLS